MNKNKFLALILSLFLTIGLVPSVAVHASEVNPNSEIVQSNNLYDLDESMYNDDASQEIKIREKRGVKSKAVSKIAKLLLKNTNKVIKPLKSMGLLDDASALALGANFDKISRYLDNIASYGDNAAAFVAENLPSVLNGWGVEKGTSQMIAKALSYAIKGADWIFGF